MRAQIASLPFALVVLLYFSQSAAAQSSTTSSKVRQQSPQKLPFSAKPLELPRATETTPLQGSFDAAENTAKTLPVPKNWAGLLQRREDWSGLRGFGGGLDGAQCAHIRIFQAPNLDSEMIIDAPPGAGGNITTFRGLPPCCRDLPHQTDAQRYPGLLQMFPVPRRMPSVQPPGSKDPGGQRRFAQPKPSAAPSPEP